MLKIIDYMPLTELEAYGFKKDKTKYYIETPRDLMYSEKYAVFPKSKVLAIAINIKTRKITCTKNIVSWQDQTRIDLLFDLIKDGLVEKVEDNNVKD